MDIETAIGILKSRRQAKKNYLSGLQWKGRAHGRYGARAQGDGVTYTIRKAGGWRYVADAKLTSGFQELIAIKSDLCGVLAAIEEYDFDRKNPLQLYSYWVPQIDQEDAERGA